MGLPGCLSASQEQEGAVVGSRCWQGHCLAGTGSSRMCLDKSPEILREGMSGWPREVAVGKMERCSPS